MESTIITKDENGTTKKIMVPLTTQQKKALKDGALGLGGVIAGAGLFNLFGNSNANSSMASEDIDDNNKAEVEVCEVDTDLDIASKVTNEMNFEEAFASARAEVGPGGFFNWKGNSYNTYYKEEWDQLTDDEKQEFFSLVDDNVDATTVQEFKNNIDFDGDGNAEVTYKEVNGESVIESVDLNDDGFIDVIHDTEQTLMQNDIDINQTIQYDILDAEPVYGETDISGNGIIDAISIDTNADGLVDAMAADLDSDGRVDTYLLNIDEEEGLDVLIIDDAQDGIDDNDDFIDIDENVSMDSFLIIDESELNNDVDLDYLEI